VSTSKHAFCLALFALQNVHMGWLRLVGSIKLEVSFAEYSLFYEALLQQRHILLRSLLIVATPYQYVDVCTSLRVGLCVCMYVSMYASSMFVHIYVCMYVCMYIYACMYVCLQVCMFMCMYGYGCMYVCMVVCMYVRICTCMYVRMYFNICVCVLHVCVCE